MSARMKATPAPAPASAEEALPGATYRDAFALVLGERIGVPEAAQRTLGATPGWVKGLMNLRNALVAPFGLKDGPRPEQQRRIGFFPILSENEHRMVLGLDDKHLDFRIVLDVEPDGESATRVTATTLVKTHNAFGRAYLATVMPFHRLIVPVMLNQAAN